MGAAGLRDSSRNVRDPVLLHSLLSATLALFLKACSRRRSSCWEWAGAEDAFMFWRFCQQLRFACSLFCKQAREWNGWGWLASAWPHGTSWPAVILLRDECVSGSSSVLPSCGFGVLYGRSRKSKIAWGTIRMVCTILGIGDKGGRGYVREDERRRGHSYLKKPVNWGNRDLNFTKPLLTEVSTVFHGLEVPGHPPHLVDSPSAAAVT